MTADEIKKMTRKHTKAHESDLASFRARMDAVKRIIAEMNANLEKRKCH